MADKEVRSTAAPYWRPPSSSALVGRTCSWLLGLALLALVIFSVLSENGLGEYLRLRAQREKLQQELATLRAETSQLEARLEALRRDPFALEKLARERYNMRREGEEVLLLVPEERIAGGGGPARSSYR
jgi:cell division protein FtsB